MDPDTDTDTDDDPVTLPDDEGEGDVDPTRIEIEALRELADMADDLAGQGGDGDGDGGQDEGDADAEGEVLPDQETEDAAIRFTDVTAGCIAAFRDIMPLAEQVSVDDGVVHVRPGAAPEPLAHQIPDPRGFLLESIISAPFVGGATGVTSPEATVRLVAGIRAMAEADRDGLVRIVNEHLDAHLHEAENATHLTGALGMALSQRALAYYHTASEARERALATGEQPATRSGNGRVRPRRGAGGTAHEGQFDPAASATRVSTLASLLFPPDPFGVRDAQRPLQQVLLHACGLPVFDARAGTRLGVDVEAAEWRCALDVGTDARVFPPDADTDAMAYAVLDEACAVLDEWNRLAGLAPGVVLADVDPLDLDARTRREVVRCADWLELLRASFASLQEQFCATSDTGATLLRTTGTGGGWGFTAGRETYRQLRAVADLDAALAGHGARFDYAPYLSVQYWAFAHRAFAGARENAAEPGAVERLIVRTPQELRGGTGGGRRGVVLATTLTLAAAAGLAVLGAHALGLVGRAGLLGEAAAYIDLESLGRPAEDFFDTARSLGQLRDDRRLLTVFSTPERAFLWGASAVGGVLMLARAMLARGTGAGAYSPCGAVFLLGGLHATLENAFVTAALTTFSRSPEVWRVLHGTARALLFSAVGGELVTAMQQLIAVANAERVGPVTDVVIMDVPEVLPAAASTLARLQPLPYVIDPYGGTTDPVDFVAAALLYANVGDEIAVRQL